MKYLVVFFLSFMVIFPAQAAKEVQGTVPNLAPLQPPPAGVTLDYENPLNSPLPEEEDEDGLGSGGDGVGSGRDFLEDRVPSSSTLEQQDKNSVVSIVTFLLFVIIFAGGGMYFIRRGKSK